MARRRLRLTGFTRFLLFLIIVTPVAYFGITYAKGEKMPTSFQDFVDQFQKTEVVEKQQSNTNSDTNSNSNTTTTASDCAELELEINDLENRLLKKSKQVDDLEEQVGELKKQVDFLQAGNE